MQTGGHGVPVCQMTWVVWISRVDGPISACSLLPLSMDLLALGCSHVQGTVCVHAATGCVHALGMRVFKRCDRGVYKSVVCVKKAMKVVLRLFKAKMVASDGTPVDCGA